MLVQSQGSCETLTDFDEILTDKIWYVSSVKGLARLQFLSLFSGIYNLQSLLCILAILLSKTLSATDSESCQTRDEYRRPAKGLSVAGQVVRRARKAAVYQREFMRKLTDKHHGFGFVLLPLQRQAQPATWEQLPVTQRWERTLVFTAAIQAHTSWLCEVQTQTDIWGLSMEKTNPGGSWSVVPYTTSGKLR